MPSGHRWLTLALGLALLPASPASGGDCPPPPHLIEFHALSQAGRFSEAEAEARRVARELDRLSEPETVIRAQALEALALGIVRAGSWTSPEALQAARRAVEIKEKVVGSSHPLYADALTVLGEIEQFRNELSASQAHHEQALSIRREILGEEHPDAAASTFHLAILAFSRDRFRESRVLFERAVSLWEKAPGPDAPDLGRALAHLGAVLWFEGRLIEAVPVAERAVRILERGLGPAHPRLAHALATLAEIREFSGDPAGAKVLYERALRLTETALGLDHPEVAKRLFVQSLYVFRAGDYEEAGTLRKRALDIAERRLGPTALEVASYAGDYAIALWHLGERTESRSLFERAVQVARLYERDNPTPLARVINALGLFLFFIGDYEAALPYAQQSLRTIERESPDDTVQIPYMLNNLAYLYLKIGRFREALPYAERAERIARSSWGQTDPDLARVLSTAATLAARTGNRGRARSLHGEALAIWEKQPPPGHSDIGLDLEGLGEISIQEGRAAEAMAHFRRALEARERTQGSGHPDLAVTLEGLARAVWMSGDSAGALDLALRAEEIGREHLRTTARALSDREALGYAAVRPSGLDVALSIVAAESPERLPPEAAERVWDPVVRSRALVLDEMAERARSLASIERPGASALRSRLELVRRKLAQALLMGSGPGGPEKHRSDLAAMQDEKERVERALAGQSARFRESLERAHAGIGEVLEAIPEGAALAGFARFNRWRRSAEGAGEALQKKPSYLAFVAAPGASSVAAIPLEGVDEIDALVRRWREEIAAPRAGPGARGRSESSYRHAADALRRAVWDPLAPRLKDARQVFVVPEGALNLVNLAALTAPAGDFLVETGPRLHLLSAERDLVRSARKTDAGGALLALGAPDYEARLQAPAGAVGGGRSRGAGSSSSVTEAPAATALGRAAMYRGSAADCEALRQRRFEPLPAAWLEAREVEGLWRAKARGGAVPPRLLTRAAADEGSFKRLAPEFSVIHLATHGFFAEGCDEGGGPGEAESRQAFVDNPLLLSGLALAGANRRGEMKLEGAGGTGEAGGAGEAGAIGGAGEDGMLTAEEITSLDLSKADWVVLSACETGLGKLEAGEGVLGLRRAFQIAGAGTLIMSLWPVEDAATREWMKHLYEERLRGASTSEAVRSASLRVIEERRKAGKSIHPSTWGAFVAAGDWR